jgi:hypothetical protein
VIVFSLDQMPLAVTSMSQLAVGVIDGDTIDAVAVGFVTSWLPQTSKGSVVETPDHEVMPPTRFACAEALFDQT